MVQDTGTQVYDLPFADRAVLDFETDFGRVEIQPLANGSGPTLTLDGDVRDFNVHIGRDGEAVRVNVVRAGAGGWFGRWDARIVMHVPKDVSARIRTQAGSIDARDLEDGLVELRTQAGRIGLDKVKGRVRVQTDAGSIRGQGLAGTFRVEAHAGSIHLDFLALDAGEHIFTADVGSIQLGLPEGANVDVQARTTMGKVKVPFPAKPGAPIVVRVSTEIGAVVVDQGPSQSSRDWFSWHGEGGWRGQGGWLGDLGRHGRRPEPTPRPEPPSSQGRTEETRRILDMVAAGKLTAKEAEELLRALE